MFCKLIRNLPIVNLILRIYEIVARMEYSASPEQNKTYFSLYY